MISRIRSQTQPTTQSTAQPRAPSPSSPSSPPQAQQREQYLYHRKPPQQRGDVLYPLNRMQDLPGFESVAAREAAKYDGREGTKQNYVGGGLSCLWNDVLFFSPIDPRPLYRELTAAGHSPRPPAQFYKIPASALADKPAAYFGPGPPAATNGGYITRSRYAPFDASSYQELHDVPEATRAYYRAEAEAGRSAPLFFTGVPHVLLKDSLDTRNLEVVAVNPPSQKALGVRSTAARVPRT